MGAGLVGVECGGGRRESGTSIGMGMGMGMGIDVGPMPVWRRSLVGFWSASVRSTLASNLGKPRATGRGVGIFGLEIVVWCKVDVFGIHLAWGCATLPGPQISPGRFMG